MEPQLPDSEAVRAANIAYYRAFEASDLDSMAELWASSVPVSCVLPGWQPAVGRDAVVACWASVFQGLSSISFTLRNIQIFIVGEVAWALLLEDFSASQENGQRLQVVLQATNIFLREGSAWKLAHHHASPALGAALPPSDPRRLFH